MGWLKNRIEKYKKKRTDKRLNKLEGDLNMIISRGYTYNPKYYRLTEYISPEEEYSLSVIENLVWFTGQPRLIRGFYQQNIQYVMDLNLFWLKAPANYRKTHSGIPGIISTKSATILFGGGVDFDITVYKVGEDGKRLPDTDKKLTKKAQEAAAQLNIKTKLAEKMEEAATNESWSGHLFWKIGYDINASSYPIHEIATVRTAEAVRIRGVTTDIIFKAAYQKGGVKYEHREIYSTTENDDAVIYNELYKVEQDGKEIPVPLTTLDETADLVEEFVFKGVKGMLAFEKPNKLPNNTFPECQYGASDYSGAATAFDSLDEIWSEMVSEVRQNKTKRYVPSTMIRYLTNHTGTDANIDNLDPFVENYVKIDGDPDQDAKNEILVTQISDKQESLQAKWRVAITTVLNIAGLSPYSIGITGLESVSASAESQQERNKTTLETRSKKLKLWKPFLEDVQKQTLAFNDWMLKNLPITQDDIDMPPLNFASCDVSVKFGDYIIERQADKLTTWGNAKQQKVASTDTAVREIWPDWDESEVNKEVNIIRFEDGMGFDNPNNLPKLDGYEDEPEDEEDGKEPDKAKEQKEPEDITELEHQAQKKEPKE